MLSIGDSLLCPNQGSKEQQEGPKVGWEEGGEGTGKAGHRSPRTGLHFALEGCISGSNKRNRGPPSQRSS